MKNKINIEKLMQFLPEEERAKLKSIDGTEHKTRYSAFDLLTISNKTSPKLLDPLFHNVGLASIVGESESGKSTLLRQLSLSIILDEKSFLGYKLNPRHKKVIYVSTEDDAQSIKDSLTRQLKKYSGYKKEELKNLEFIFDTNNILSSLEDILKKNPVDLIIIDAFADIFTREINANTEVRKFLNSYSSIATKHQCLIVFLHHIGKRTQYKKPSKDSIIGSQAFEAKMRIVLELRKSFRDNNKYELWITKSNYLASTYKNKGLQLSMDSDSLTFEKTNLTLLKSKGSNKMDNTETIKKVMEFHKQGLSVRKIEEELKGTPNQISKTSINTIIKRNNQ